MLIRRKGSSIYIDIGVNLDRGYIQTTGFQKRSERGGNHSFSHATNDATSYQDVFHPFVSNVNLWDHQMWRIIVLSVQFAVDTQSEAIRATIYCLFAFAARGFRNWIRLISHTYLWYDHRSFH